LALNWKPDPQFGGFYAAPYVENKLDVEILPGGAGTPTVQMIGAGSAEFGIVSADELVVARSRGNDVVALFAVFQDTPQGLMVHEERGLTAIEEVFEKGTVALQKGLPYARLLEKEFGFDNVKIVPSPGGDITAFLNDPLFAQQCFLMSEPLQARHAGAKVTVFPVADIGYNPYTTVLAVNGQYLKDNAATVESMVTAVRDGWRAYLKDPKPTNTKMHEMNPSMDVATFAEVAEAQRPFIENDDTATRGLGSMTRERWEKLIGQLQGLGDIPNAIPPEDCFRAV
jgi:NitT/TauT family transport system substrate-binding protein